MEIGHEFDGKKGAFCMEDNGKRLAEMVYVMAGDTKMIVDHTEVDDSLRGQGVGKKLQAELVAYVREKGIKVVPLCPFAKVTFEKTPEWQDVVF